ncbi:MAG: PrsW family intramembrane metalloprotease [Bacteroidales bacterium]|jgi:RsiW-degrading membrane proteinase PrsW (M82 family)|nr:PrsW family intramembrane metalloprotease [Bacteroidales bacterium]MBR6863306.1 PrsW family intramembrane metalloprotease [Bacteroidales bacterium]
MINVIALAVLPALILLYYTYQQDKMQREPVKMVAKGFGFGCLSVFCSFFISIPSMRLGLFPEEINSLGDAVRQAFFGAAIPEETAKLFCLWLFLRKNPYFDERMDGIVYAVSVGLGFAAFENVEYLFAAGTDWVTTGIGRSLTAIPGHFGFAVLMGYYYSLYHFDRYRAPGAGLKMWLYPVLGHGIYDSIAMMSAVTPQLSGAITIAILMLCFQMIKWARKSMQKHLIADASDYDTGGVDIQG